MRLVTVIFIDGFLQLMTFYEASRFQLWAMYIFINPALK